MLIARILTFITACLTVITYVTTKNVILTAILVGLTIWYSVSSFASNTTSLPNDVLHFGKFSWDVSSFCRGWLITGQVGTGKTAAAINTMLWQVSKNCPTWGGVCVDDKGLYHETLSNMLGHLGHASELIILQVRPENAPPDWKPPHTFNFLDNPHLPWSAKAKMICDVASAMGQRTEQSFFKMQAQVQLEFAFKALAEAKVGVSLTNAHQFLLSQEIMAEVMAAVSERGRPCATELLDHYQHNFLAQPAEQLGGVKTTLANYLKPFTEPDIAQIFSPDESTVDFSDIDKGKIICVSIPQRYTVERRYINTLLKLTYYSHVLRRFDKTAAERAKDNLLILWADEAQKIVTASDDGISDYNVVDVIREAKATVVAATQSYTSLVPPMGDERKAKVFIANMANRITFCAADEDSAKIAADTLGQRKAQRRTYGWSGGKRSTSYTEETRYHIESHEFRRLRRFEAVVHHCDQGFKKMTLPPMGPDGRIPAWYKK